LKETADIFKSLSEECRLRILAMLEDGREVCVCKLTEVLKSTHSRTSRHLAYLKRMKIVSSRRKGQWMYYKLNDKIEPEIGELLKAIRPFIKQTAQGRKDIKKLCEIEENGECKTVKKIHGS